MEDKWIEFYKKSCKDINDRERLTEAKKTTASFGYEVNIVMNIDSDDMDDIEEISDKIEMILTRMISKKYKKSSVESTNIDIN